MSLPKMITLQQASDATGVAYEALRQLCLRGKIVHIKTGNKYLINAEKLGKFLNGDKEVS